jgi:hypothetical protein
MTAPDLAGVTAVGWPLGNMKRARGSSPLRRAFDEREVRDLLGTLNYTPRCSYPGQQLCQRLGIPPTTDVADRRWHLSACDRRIAAAQVDAYMWLGRPWMVNAGPFSLRDALTLGANGAC